MLAHFFTYCVFIHATVASHFLSDWDWLSQKHAIYNTPTLINAFMSFVFVSVLQLIINNVLINYIHLLSLLQPKVKTLTMGNY